MTLERAIEVVIEMAIEIMMMIITKVKMIREEEINMRTMILVI